MTGQERARVFAAFGPHLPDQEREAHTPKNLQINSHGIRLIRHLDIAGQLRRADSPTLVSVGELDPVTPVAAAEEITGALPEGIARLEIIAGAGHFTWKDVPDRYGPMMIQFINGTIGPELAVARAPCARCREATSRQAICRSARDRPRPGPAARATPGQGVTVIVTVWTVPPLPPAIGWVVHPVSW